MNDVDITMRRGQRALRRGRVSLPHHMYHVTVVTEARTPYFKNPDAAREVAKCLDAPALRGDAEILAWVLMPDHAHLLLQLGPCEGLATLVARLKSAGARKANAALNRKGQLWQKGYHDRALRKDDDVRKVAQYLVANPLRAGLVSHLGEYPYWNCTWL